MTAHNEYRTTNDAGIPVASDSHSLQAGPQGPLLLHDHYLVEKLAHFNRERVPERVVHAKGAGAFGELVITGDVGEYTKADFLQPGRRTDVLFRFSTVAGEQGSPDTWRDPRGFAMKFYTDEGNYDLVGNNTPIFFLRDAIKFPDFIHSQKRMPGTGLRDHDMQWDFWTNSPESAHQVTWVMGDRGIPKTYRHMDGFGSHTYMWINSEGERVWVKYHFKTDQGIECLTKAEADALSGTDPDHHRKDIHEAIARGEYPSWSLKVQIMPFEDAARYRVDPFDLTKVWSQKDYPLIDVGRVTLNRNPENFFAQIEQASFSPSNVVPGIGFSPDKMLLGRVFAYADAQRYRTGANHMELPVNRPKCPVHSYSQDGALRHGYASPQRPVYAPNSHGGPHADPSAVGPEPGWEAAGEFGRYDGIRHPEDDDWSQAGDLVRNVMDDAQRERLVGNIVGHLCAGVTEPVLKRAFEYWTNVDADLGRRVEEGVRAAQR